MDDYSPIVFALVLLAFAAVGIKTGEAGLGGAFATRIDRPVTFWILVVGEVLIAGAILLVAAVKATS